MTVIEKDAGAALSENYMVYAAATIRERALPDARDGLKPSQRRMLIAMNELKLNPSAKFRKCAKICGDVSGNYHPHGEQVAYPTLVRMAQDFSMRYPLMEPQGNFGSLDGDEAAAMRYTESRLTSIAMEFMRDLGNVKAEAEAVIIHRDNYDATRKEPVVLPTRVPAMLLNGGSGIAVGMASDIWPHNLVELIDLSLLLLENPQANYDEIWEIFKGPDFANGGIIQMTREQFEEIYSSGSGSTRIRARVKVETSIKGDKKVIITQTPHNINRTRLIQDIVKKVENKSIQGITDVRNESNQDDGTRICLDLGSRYDPQTVINQLYYNTLMETSISCKMICIINKQPTTVDLKTAINVFLEHRKNVVTNRSKYFLKRSNERRHIVQGLLKAIDKIDEVIKIVRKYDIDETKKKIKVALNIDDSQIEAILALTLRHLSKLENQNLTKENDELEERIKELSNIIDDPVKLHIVVREELEETKKQFNESRRTTVTESFDKLSKDDIINDDQILVTLSTSGNLKASLLEEYKRQRRRGEGAIGAKINDDEHIKEVTVTSTRDQFLAITNRNRAYKFDASQIPLFSKVTKGIDIKSIVNFKFDDEELQQLMRLPKETKDNEYVLCLTNSGYIKRIPVDIFKKVRVTGVYIHADERDTILDICIVNDEQDIFVATKKGKSIRMPIEDVKIDSQLRGRGLVAIELEKDDTVVKAFGVTDDVLITSITENGYAKKTKASEYSKQRRRGKGILNLRTSDKVGDVIAVYPTDDSGELILFNKNSKVIRFKMPEIRDTYRNSQGVMVQSSSEEVKITASHYIDCD